MPDRIPARPDVAAVIGPEAERIAWLWCAGARATLDPGANTIRLRETGATEPLTDAEAGDVATLWAAGTVEQVHRTTGDERAFATGLLRVLASASEPAQRAVRARALPAG